MSGAVWRSVLCAAALAATLAMPATASAPAGVRNDSSLERAIVAEINAVRAAHGLGALRASAELWRAADGHSRAMAQHGFFAHSSRDGTAFWKRIARDYPSAGSGRWAVGENLLWSTSTLDAGAAVRMWLDSPPHRRVLLTDHWRDVGVAAVRADAAPGRFGGRGVTIVTADFGLRR